MLHYLLEQQNKYCNQKSENFEILNVTKIPKTFSESEEM